ncbi:anther-specific proline-rich protein APG [Zea mays]|uniref:GDSL esterase/lipase EXL3 n=1 Tax=Zea mays TaxID=4577 RepID=A0A1D6GRY9_MAIZE|nr:anther-specific proline-rich protein APG [Zea mays]AQK65832.1 GDSL esterase/lipase EXL3 [Zea mays]|eukprot:XP_008644878.1 anther-specific proline-rich protein APG [Zea mays]
MAFTALSLLYHLSITVSLVLARGIIIAGVVDIAPRPTPLPLPPQPLLAPSPTPRPPGLGAPTRTPPLPLPLPSPRPPRTPPTTTPLPRPWLGAPSPARVPRPPRLGAPPRTPVLPSPRVGAPSPAPPPVRPPQLGAPLPTPVAPTPQLEDPSRGPILPRPPLKGVPPSTPPLVAPRLGAPLPSPPVPSARKGTPPPPPQFRVPIRSPVIPPPQKGIPPSAPLIPAPRLGVPLPSPPVQQPPRTPILPPSRKGAPPSIPPLSPPKLGAPLPSPLFPPPRLGAPPRTPILAPPPQVRAVFPSPRSPPPRLGAPLPTPLLPPQYAAAPPPPPSPSPPMVVPSGPKVPALLAFGDSIVDTGNNNYLVTVVKANFPPYGREYPNHKATGRFSDGKITVDFLASALGLKETLPPYLNKSLTLEDLKTGVSFASAGSGYNNATCRTSSTMTIERQLQLFSEYKAKVGGIHERALFVVCSGSNDIVEHFTLADGMTSPEYADMMARRAIGLVEALIGQGARQIALTGAPPVGCVPSQRRIAGGVRMQCATDRNQLALLFNRKLSLEVAKLSGKYRGVNIFYVDLYSVLADVVQRYQALGFKDGKDACCGYVGLAVGPLCNIGSRTCPDPSKYVFWDSYHPTERAYKLMMDDFLTRYMRYIH